jgi:ATP-dependent DNA helicase PIF1
MLNEMRYGTLSPKSIARFQQLSREIMYEDGIGPTEL